MNSKKKRVLSIAVLASMLLSLTACGGNANDAIANKKAGEIAKEFKAPTIPDGVTFEGGHIRVLGMEKLVEGVNGTEDAPVGAVAQELYDRNRRCEERFGITITFTNHQTDWSTTIPTAVKQSVQSGSNDYEVVFATASVQTPLINAGMYLPITMYNKYIDLTQPWWNDEYIYSVSLTDAAPYALFGNLTYNQVERTTAVFANTTKFEDMFNILPDQLFGHVLDGSWTLDKFTEYVNMGYRDLNGNTKADVGDMYGLTVTGMAINFTAYGAGLEFTKRDDEGFPVLNLNTDDAQKLNEKIVALYSGNKAVQNIGNQEHVAEFGKGNALFMANRLFIAGWPAVREMKDDFILLPYPKFNEKIDGYHCPVEPLVQWGCVMSTVPDEDLDMISAAMEQMCYDGYQTVTPLYYENDLKLKYSRGDDVDTQSKVLDIIVENAYTDFLLINNVGTIGSVFQNSVNTGKTNNFTSFYDSNKNKALNELEDMIDDYRKLGI